MMESSPLAKWKKSWPFSLRLLRSLPLVQNNARLERLLVMLTRRKSSGTRSSHVASEEGEERSVALHRGDADACVRSDGRVVAVGEATSACGGGSGIRHACRRRRSVKLTMGRCDDARGDVDALDRERRAGVSKGSRGGEIFWRRAAELRLKEATII